MTTIRENWDRNIKEMFLESCTIAAHVTKHSLTIALFETCKSLTEGNIIWAEREIEAMKSCTYTCIKFKYAVHLNTDLGLNHMTSCSHVLPLPFACFFP